MLAKALCELAAHIGLSQTAIAHHLGIDRSNVSNWARGRHPLPEQHREAFVALVFAKAKAQSDRAKRGLPQARRRFFRRLLPLVLECRAENLAARGLEEGVSVASLVEQLQPFKTMPEAELLQPHNARRVLALSQGLADVMTINAQHDQLMSLLKEFRHADRDDCERETSEPVLSRDL